MAQFEGGLPCWKRFLLGMYYYGTLPYRRMRSIDLAHAGQAPIAILFYHRVADHQMNAWTMPTQIFERQLRWLQKHFDLVSLGEAQNRLRSGSNHRPTVSITFDDGYADNCHRALPLLIEQGIPCTYFVSTHHVLNGAPFPHDVARKAPLPPNTPREIQELAEAGIEIGAHTRTHADLGRIATRYELEEEVVTAKLELQQLTGHPVRYFAFPYGQHYNLTTAAIQLAFDAGYQGVCSAYGGFNFPGDDPFHLQRIHADPDHVRFRNWLTVDPRKLAATRRFTYTLSAVPLPQATSAPT